MLKNEGNISRLIPLVELELASASSPTSPALCHLFGLPETGSEAANNGRPKRERIPTESLWLHDLGATFYELPVRTRLQLKPE